MERILVMDVGNTNTALGLYNGAELLHRWQVSTVWTRTADEWGMLLRSLFADHGVDSTHLAGVVISCVVPPLMSALQEMSLCYFRSEPLIVGPGIRTGLVIKAENPREVGADRIANAVAATHLYKPPLIVIDMGTATTFCVIDEEGQYVGGPIAPGLHIAAEALFQHTAKLPRVDIAQPRQVVGRNTVSSMQSGIFYGYVGLVDGLVDRIHEELPLSFTVVATGGVSRLVCAASKRIHHVEPNLTLHGLRVLWMRNR